MIVGPKETILAWGLSVLLIIEIAGCATTYVEGEPSLKESIQEKLPEFPPYDGPKTVVAVLPLGLSKQAAQRYPHLLKRDVGFGIHNRVIEALYDTGRFRLVEEKREVIKEVMDRQWMSSAGMVDQNTAVRLGRILGAKKVIYGEVYDYAEGGEQVIGFSAKSRFKIRIGVQIRCVDIETLEYVPASGVAYDLDVGSAAERAIRKAVYSLINRLE